MRTLSARLCGAPMLVACMALNGCGSSHPVSGGGAPGRGVSIQVLSNRADLISGGDAYVRIVAPDTVDASKLKVLLNGRDVSAMFAARANGQILGVVTGLVNGANQLRATLPDGHGARLAITNHPIGGPVFAGPQIQPWICGTQTAGLGAPSDDQCDAPTTYTYQYKSTITGLFQTYDPASPAKDVASTTTTQGITVPYIVRLETGVIDRGIYQVAVLFDPAKAWQPWSPQSGWNGKVVWLFGGGTAPHYTQDSTPSAIDDNALSHGFATATGSMNVHGSNANDVVSAEALMMLKEHFIETYGPITSTIGAGCSGGGLQQYIIGNAYPGLLDGIMPTCSFPDIWTTAEEVADCSLLYQYFTGPAAPMWLLPTQQAAVEGHSLNSSCLFWQLTFAPNIKPTVASDCNLPAEQVYDPQTNPRGARCTLSDYAVAVLGRRPAAVWGDVEKQLNQGFANRPIGNAGVQYGLSALQAGTISPAQFVDMNVKVGCYDIDGNATADRCKADPGSEALSYRAALVNDARQLGSIPIIDLRGQDDIEIHTTDWSYVTRGRLDKANGGHDNQVIFIGAEPIVGDTAFACSENIAAGLPGLSLPPLSILTTLCSANPLLLMDQWITAIQADPSVASAEQKVVRNRPAAAVDTCFIAGHPVTDAAVCAATFPHYSSPRDVAGGPATRDILTCQLKPMVAADYLPTTFTAEQWAQLQAAFPSGVCDWTKPDASEQASIPWMDFSTGPGGQPLGAAPASVAD